MTNPKGLGDMGQTADDAVDGLCCCLCGVYFAGERKDELYEHVFAQTLPALPAHRWKALRKEYQRALVRTL